MKKEEYKQLQKLIIANSALIGSLIQHMSDKGIVDGEQVIKIYDDNLNSLVKDLIR